MIGGQDIRSDKALDMHHPCLQVQCTDVNVVFRFQEAEKSCERETDDIAYSVAKMPVSCVKKLAVTGKPFDIAH